MGGDESVAANRSGSRKWPLRGCIAPLVAFQLLAAGVAFSGSRALRSSFDAAAGVEPHTAQKTIIAEGMRTAASRASWLSLAAIGSALVAGALAAVHGAFLGCGLGFNKSANRLDSARCRHFLGVPAATVNFKVRDNPGNSLHALRIDAQPANADTPKEGKHKRVSSHFATDTDRFVQVSGHNRWCLILV